MNGGGFGSNRLTPTIAEMEELPRRWLIERVIYLEDLLEKSTGELDRLRAEIVGLRKVIEYVPREEEV